MISRRRFVLGCALGGLAVSLGAVARARRQGVFVGTSGAAYEPWLAWNAQDLRSEPAELVRSAVLAASPHNTQPWFFGVSSDRIEVWTDPTRSLGTMDPFARELHVGLGCAIENLVLAARCRDYNVTVELAGGRLTSPAAPDGAGGPSDRVALIRLSPGQRDVSELHGAIGSRHTNRGPYEARGLSPQHSKELASLAAPDEAVRLILLESRDHRQAFIDGTVRATERIVRDAQMVQDSHRWFRSSEDEIERHRDGVTLAAAGLSPLILAAAKMLPDMSPDASHAHWLETTRTVHLATAPVFGLLAVRDLYDRASTLRAGRLWQRIHLWAVSRGVAAQPLNQLAEVADREHQLSTRSRIAPETSQRLGLGDWAPTFAFRLGYAIRAAAPSPRRAVESVTRAIVEDGANSPG